MNKRVLYKSLPFARSFGIHPINVLVGIVYLVIDVIDVVDLLGLRPRKKRFRIPGNKIPKL